MLVGDVLDTSRIEAGTFSYRFGEVDVASLVEDAVATAGLRQAGVSVRAVLEEPLPPVRGDKERLGQVLRTSSKTPSSTRRRATPSR